MVYHQNGLPPVGVRLDEFRIRRIVEFWNYLRACDETGETSWETLEPLERAVTECLSRDPPDIDAADSLTAKAFFLIVGQGDL
jgi:hypothetical protein